MTAEPTSPTISSPDPATLGSPIDNPRRRLSSAVSQNGSRNHRNSPSPGLNKPRSRVDALGSSSGSNTSGMTPKDYEIESLKQQLKIAKSSISELQSKVSVMSSPRPSSPTSPKPNPAPFGSSTARNLIPFPSESSSSSSTGRNSPNPGHNSTGRLVSPGSVALNRALVSEDPGPTSSSTSSSTQPSPNPNSDPVDSLQPIKIGSSAHARLSMASSPFFGSGAASRDRLAASASSASSGSGKVIAGLQSDLLQARTGLESTRGQLRNSQRAVESLMRQNDDLKETKERLTSEIEGLQRIITRKERMQEEALARARIAEAGLTELQIAHRELSFSSKKQIKELEVDMKKADELRKKAESEYSSLAKGMRSMSEGFKADLEWMRQDLAKSHTKLAASTALVSKLLTSPPTPKSMTSSISIKDLSSTPIKHRTQPQPPPIVTTKTPGPTKNPLYESLELAQKSLSEAVQAETSKALKQVELMKRQTEKDMYAAKHLKNEFERLRRLMIANEEQSTGA